MIPGPVYLAYRHARTQRLQSLILIACLAIATALPLSTSMLMTRYDRTLRERAEQTALVAGARGSRFDLVLATTHFRLASVVPTTFGLAMDIQEQGLGLAIPMSVRHTARGHVVVGTGIEYTELRGFRYQQGGWPTTFGECVLGAAVARAEGLAVGNAIFSDQEDLYDISKAPAIRLRVVGVLAPTGGPDDAVVFVDIATAWLLDGIVHGHDDVVSIGQQDPKKVLGRTGTDTALSGAVIEYQEVDPGQLDSYHMHADPRSLPITSVLIVPDDQRAATLLTTEINLSKTEQVVSPAKVTDELLSYVVRIKSVIDAVSAAFIVTNILLAVLVLMLSFRMRERERQTMSRIGCSRWAVPCLFLAEFGGLASVGVVMAIVISLAVRAFAPELMAMI